MCEVKIVKCLVRSIDLCATSIELIMVDFLSLRQNGYVEGSTDLLELYSNVGFLSSELLMCSRP